MRPTGAPRSDPLPNAKSPYLETMRPPPQPSTYTHWRHHLTQPCHHRLGLVGTPCRGRRRPNCSTPRPVAAQRRGSWPMARQCHHGCRSGPRHPRRRAVRSAEPPPQRQTRPIATIVKTIGRRAHASLPRSGGDRSPRYRVLSTCDHGPRKHERSGSQPSRQDLSAGDGCRVFKSGRSGGHAKTVERLAGNQHASLLDASRQMAQTTTQLKTNLDHRQRELGKLDEALAQERERHQKI